MITILSFILVISVVVVIHELGHFLAAKSIGVRVEKFYVGFNFFGLGWSTEHNGTEYGIGLFPLGGYVKVAGIIDESMDVESTGSPDEFRSKSTLGKVWIMSAGVIMNFLLAILIISHLTYYNGVNDPDPRAIVGQVMPGYPAENLGLQTGDQILSINKVQVTTWEDITQEIHSKPDELINLSWQRNENIQAGLIKTVIAEQLPWNQEIIQGMIGIAPIYNHRDATIIESFINGCVQTYYWLEITYRSLMALVLGDISIKEMAGPIMIAKMAGETASSGGIIALLGLMAIISVNLGLINILPIPGLDGGHVVIALIEGVIRRDLSNKMKLGIQQAGLLLILMLFITIMINDVQRLLQ